MGSGSSAITDLVSEFDGYEAAKGSFEYVFLHCPNGVFDLEDKLLKGNNAIRSDEALHSFYSTMRQLYDKKYWWVGNYKENISDKFWEITKEYIDSLIQYKPEFYWYYQENTNVKMFFQLVIKRLVKCMSFGKITLKKPLLYSPMWISYIGEQEFYEKTRSYLWKILSELGIQEKNIVLDQLLLPFNLHRMRNYFCDLNAEAFVVERDPRDVFITNKYVWSAQNEQVPYPIDVEEFCKVYRNLRSMEDMKTNFDNHIHRIHFEDLIYKYEEMCEYVQKILKQESIPMHVRKRQLFNPEKSIENTQLFFGNERYKKEVEIIEKLLPEYLYEFPYGRKTDMKKTF